jgi:hypothetical protein
MPVNPDDPKAERKPSHATLYALTWVVGLGTLALGAGGLYWYVVLERNELPWGALLLIPCVAVIAAVTFRNQFR